MWIYKENANTWERYISKNKKKKSIVEGLNLSMRYKTPFITLSLKYTNYNIIYYDNSLSSSRDSRKKVENIYLLQDRLINIPSGNCVWSKNSERANFNSLVTLIKWLNIVSSVPCVALVFTRKIHKVKVKAQNIRRLFRKSIAPNVGLEPTTLRLRVSCSTDWASRAAYFQTLGTLLHPTGVTWSIHVAETVTKRGVFVWADAFFY